ncbi:hypothetical protein ABIB57_005112 [Devosia sp. UYZn731]|uniref:hypothetical protein n=1 Tax=Devosia sp. UYZn731 TaxID=3156345 RepID=UPI003392C047
MEVFDIKAFSLPAPCWGADARYGPRRGGTLFWRQAAEQIAPSACPSHGNGAKMCQIGSIDRHCSQKKPAWPDHFREGGEDVAHFGDVDKTRARSYINSAFDDHERHSRTAIPARSWTTDIRSADRSTIALMRLTSMAANPPIDYGFSPQR